MPTSAIARPCPHCQQLFQPNRRNQQYCSSQCRVDANNDKAKQAYSTYQQQAPQLAPLQAELAQLKAFVQQQLLIIRGVEEIDSKTIRWQGQLYGRQEVATPELRNYGVYLQVGGGVYLVGRDEVMYSRVTEHNNTDSYRYKRKAS